MPPALLGYVDAPVPGERLESRRVVVRGWHGWEGSPALAVAVTLTCDHHTTTTAVAVGGEQRPDVARSSGEPAMAASGWRAVVEVPPPAGQQADFEAVVQVVVWAAARTAPVPLPPIAIVLPGEGLAQGTAAQGNGTGDDLRDRSAAHAVVVVDLPAGDVAAREVVPISGWALVGSRIVSRVEIAVNGVGMGRARLGLPRPDVAQRWSSPQASISGFEKLVDLSVLPDRVGWAHVVTRAFDGGSRSVAVAERWLELRDAGHEMTATDAHDPEHERRRRLVATARRGARRGAGSAPAAPDLNGQAPLNLAAVTHSLDRGGAQLWLTELLRRAGAGGRFACTVYAPADGPLRAELERQGVEVHLSPEAPWGDRAAYEGRVTELATVLAAGGHDALLANTVRSLGGADAGLAAGCPVVWAVHESMSPAMLWTVYFHRGEVAPGVERRFGEVMGGCAAVVFAADATRRLYEDVLPPGRGVVVPYGIDLAAVDAYRRLVSRDEARRRLGIDPADRLLLVVGTVEPRKSQALIAAAFADVATAYPQGRLVMVGAIDTGYSEAVQAFVAGSRVADRMQVLPVLEDTYAWYSAADVLVSASDVESLPRTMLEALAFGKPVAATAVYGVPELLTDGHDGYLFEPGDQRALSAALSKVLAEDPARLAAVGAAGRATVEAGYDSGGYAADLMLLLEGLRADPADLPEAILARAGRQPALRLTGQSAGRG